MFIANNGLIKNHGLFIDTHTHFERNSLIDFTSIGKLQRLVMNGNFRIQQSQPTNFSEAVVLTSVRGY